VSCTKANASVTTTVRKEHVMLKHRVSGQELIHIVVSLQKKHLWQSYNNVILSAFNPAVKPRAVWDTFVCGYKVQAQSLK